MTTCSDQSCWIVVSFAAVTTGRLAMDYVAAEELSVTDDVDSGRVISFLLDIERGIDELRVFNSLLRSVIDFFRSAIIEADIKRHARHVHPRNRVSVNISRCPSMLTWQQMRWYDSAQLSERRLSVDVHDSAQKTQRSPLSSPSEKRRFTRGLPQTISSG